MATPIPPVHPFLAYPILPILKPWGVGDLKVVKQRLARYEAGEIAHIENVMAREFRSREHRRLRQTVETVTSERDFTEESKRDLQSTERFELQQETERTIQSESSLQAGLDVSAGYGPVQVSAYGRIASSSSTEESDRSATNYSKEIMERSLSHIIERVREERTTRVLEEYEEKNKHEFDNKVSTDHISGIFRWVDKLYRAKVVNYGKRLMYEFYVPEPAAFYLFANRFNLDNSVLPTVPAPPMNPDTGDVLANPSEITRTNYLSMLEQYNVQGVNPPPPARVFSSIAISREIGTPAFAFSSQDLTIPDGYTAAEGYYRLQWGSHPDSWLDLKAGLNTISAGGPLILYGESGVIPISCTGVDVPILACNIEVICDLLPEAFEKWQLSTYNAIINAYRKETLDYEERLAAAQIQDGVGIVGDNPLLNRQTEREELKKSCLTLWTWYNFSNMPGIRHTPAYSPPLNYPEIVVNDAILNSQLMRLFEQAFDWHNMTYEFLPYYWGRKAVWLDNFSLESKDPVFEKFLKAGAARVMVPVQPEYAEAVLYYQLTSTFWPGGSVPALTPTSDPEVELYNSFLEELAGSEEYVGIDEDVEISNDDPETWLIKIPTDLVWLQEDGILPDVDAAG